MGMVGVKIVTFLHLPDIMKDLVLALTRLITATQHHIQMLKGRVLQLLTNVVF